MPFDITKFNKNSDVRELANAVFASLSGLEEQLNQQPQLAVNADGTFPGGLGAASSFLATVAKGKMTLSIPLGKGTKRDLNITDLGGPFQPLLPLNLVGETTSTAIPSLTEFPNSGDWGFHFNSTSPGAYYLAFNAAGTIQFVNLNTDGIFHNTQYLGRLSGTVAPVVANFPNARDWGFFENTSTSTLNLCFNDGGTLKKVTLT